MLHAITPSSSVLSLPSTSKNDAIEIADHAILDVEGDISSRPRNISSTLQKLYLWEKKLFEEVKVLLDLLIHSSFLFLQLSIIYKLYMSLSILEDGIHWSYLSA